MAYVRADLPVPPALGVCLIRQIDALGDSDRLHFDPDSETDRVRPVPEAAAE